MRESSVQFFWNLYNANNAMRCCLILTMLCSIAVYYALGSLHYPLPQSPCLQGESHVKLLIVHDEFSSSFMGWHPLPFDNFLLLLFSLVITVACTGMWLTISTSPCIFISWEKRNTRWIDFARYREAEMICSLGLRWYFIGPIVPWCKFSEGLANQFCQKGYFQIHLPFFRRLIPIFWFSGHEKG